MIWLLFHRPLKMAQDSDVINLDSRRTVKVECVEEDELEVVDEPEESAARAARTVAKAKKVKKDSSRSLAEQLADWQQQRAAK